jgi:hypothetical protein
MRPWKNALPPGAIQKSLVKAGGISAALGRAALVERPPYNELLREDAYEDEEQEWPQLHVYVYLAVLVIETTILPFNTQFMTDSVQGLTEKAGCNS